MMMMRQIAMAFTKWKDEAESLREEKRLLGGAASRWLKQKLSAAFNTWKERLAEARHQAYMMTQSLVSWCLRDLVKGFNTWRTIAYHWRLRNRRPRTSSAKRWRMLTLWRTGLVTAPRFI